MYCGRSVTFEERLHWFCIDKSKNLKCYEGDDLRVPSRELEIPFSQLWDAAKDRTMLIHMWNPTLFDVEYYEIWWEAVCEGCSDPLICY